MSTLASSFTYTGFSISAPVGTIVSYLGITDPNGWIICDGVQRTGGAGRYKELFPILNAAMGVTSNTQDSVTPPNLREKFLYGKAASTGTSGTGGSLSVTIQLANMPTHKHDVTAEQGVHTHTATVSDPGHIHNNTINDPGHTHDWNFGMEGDDDNQGSSYDEFTKQPEGTKDPPGNTIATSTTGITIGNVSAVTGIGVTLGNTKPNITVTESDKGSGTALTLPLQPHFTVNYIIKY